MAAAVPPAMVFEPLADVPVLRGVAYGLVGVGIWVGGLLFFNYLWHYFRDEEESEGATRDNV